LNATFTAVDSDERRDVRFQPEDRLVDVHELAAYLNLPVKTLYAWRYRREGPPAFRVGRHLRYRWSDVELWTQQRIEPASTGSVSASRRRVGRGG
jgi:predicted DNA-binding transcriptional regulator AlpA